MMFVLIGVVAAAFGALGYFGIVDTPASTTSLALTGVGVLTLLAALAQKQKDQKQQRSEGETTSVAPDLALQMANGVAETPAVPAMPVAPTNGAANAATPTNGAVPTNGTAPTNGIANGVVPINGVPTADVAAPSKQGLWSKLNKPVGGKEPKVKDKGKHRSRRDKHDAAQVPATPTAPIAPAQAGIATGVAVAEPVEKPSLWKRLNKPVGKREEDEDNGPLFPNGVPDTPDPFATAPEPAHAAPGMPAPGMPVTATPVAAHQAVVPGAQAEADLWQEQQVAANGATQAPPAPAVPQPPMIEQPTEQAGYPESPAVGTATAVAEPQLQAPRRGQRVCNYCWEPNDPHAAECGVCGAAL